MQIPDIEYEARTNDHANAIGCCHPETMPTKKNLHPNEEDVQICAVDIYNTKVITNHNYFTTCFFV